MSWILARLREPSTWRGLTWLLTAVGVSLSPDAWQYITTMGMAMAGLIGVITGEEPSRVEIQLPPIDLIGKSAPGWTDAQSGAGAGNPDPDPDRLRQPVRPIHNTDEAADDDNFPGWGS